MKLLKITITLILIVIFFNYLNNKLFKKEHIKADKIAQEIYLQCQQHKICPLNLKNISSAKTELPKYLEYRLTESRQKFIVSYKGGIDPDCGHVIYAGVNEEIRKEMLCENTAYITLRKTYKSSAELDSIED